MTLCDLFLTPARASDMANSQLLSSWAMYTQSWSEVFDVSNPKVRFHNGKFHSMLAAAESMGTQAELEPRWWRTPFRGNLFQNVILSGYKLREYLNNMEVSCTLDAKDGSPKAPWLKSVMELKSFDRVHQDFKARMETIKALFGIFNHETQQPFVSLVFPDEEEQNKRENAQQSYQILSAFIQDAQSKVPAQKGGGLAQFFVCLKAQLDEMIDLKQMILSSE